MSLVAAMNTFQVAKREHKENMKNQYNDKKGANGGAKRYFRASEMGSDDRKIIYSFFAHQLPKVERGAHNLRQLENGDFVHDRYQSAWIDMGVSISQEKRLSSRNDEWMSQFPWEWAGHYDGELDLNLIRAHAEGLAKVTSEWDEASGKHELIVDIDDAYGREIGLFDEEGNIRADYAPPRLVADIKTMNPWGFDKIKKNADLTKIAGYIDQIMFYMYMLKTPYGSIYIENKANNDVVEVQIVWTDFYGPEAENETRFTENIHGKKRDDQVRTTVQWSRFVGDETQEGTINRISRLWAAVEGLTAAQEAGDAAAIAQLMPERCADDPKGFPCSWGHKNGPEHVQYCEFYDHCWHPGHQGNLVAPEPAYEPCPPELLWQFEDDNGPVFIDSRKVPDGVDYDAFLSLVSMEALDYTKFLDEGSKSPEPVSVSQMERAEAIAAAETAIHGDRDMFDAEGNLFVAPVIPAAAVDVPSEADPNTQTALTDAVPADADGPGGLSPVRQVGSAAPGRAAEYIEDGGKAINCTNCEKQVRYQRLGNGGTKKCNHCGHINHVDKM